MRHVETHWGVRRGDGTVTGCGADRPGHSARWLAGVTARMLRRATWSSPGDPAATVVSREVVIVGGDWRAEPDPEDPFADRAAS